MIGPWLVCVYDASWDGDAVAALAAMVGGWQDRERLLELQISGMARGEVAASWSLPVRAGSRLAAMAGISTSTLAEYDVEVAQGAAGADPQVRPQFAGLAFRARTGDLAEGGASVELAAMLRHRPQPPRSATLGGPLMTKLERTPFDVLMIDERVSFAAGGLGGVGGTRDLGDRGGLQGLRIQLR